METIADDITVMRRTPLEPPHVAALRAIGSERRYAKGEMVARPGEPMDRFIYVEDGEEVGAASPYATSHARIFAVGDVRAGSVKRVASSVGEGSVVVSAIWALLEKAAAERAEAD